MNWMPMFLIVGLFFAAIFVPAAKIAFLLQSTSNEVDFATIQAKCSLPIFITCLILRWGMATRRVDAHYTVRAPPGFEVRFTTLPLCAFQWVHDDMPFDMLPSVA